jgi:beta-N-acetylhexosaminidase
MQPFLRFGVALLAVTFLAGMPARAEPDLRDQAFKRLAGQMLVVGFQGTSAKSPGFRSLLTDLERGVVGGVLFLYQNISSRVELETMVRQVRQCACERVPFIAIDEEGGTVERLSPAFRFKRVVTALEISRMTDDDARRQFGTLADKLASVGFNLNFAPVVDLNVNPANPVIGVNWRSYSADAAKVEKLARMFVEEHRKRGILTSLKHFPGHGSSLGDTHLAPAELKKTWTRAELDPYRGLIGNGGVDTIMVGHLSNAAEWGGVATQAGATAISKLLRADLAYDGVVISDDLTMHAVLNGKRTLGDVALSSVNAGVDIVLIAHSAGSAEGAGRIVNAALVDAMKDGRIDIAAVREANRRVLALKEKLHDLARQAEYGDR